MFQILGKIDGRRSSGTHLAVKATPGFEGLGQAFHVIQ
jgi:hypothetical protein